MEKDTKKIWEEDLKRRKRELPDFYNDNDTTENDDDADCYNDD